MKSAIAIAVLIWMLGKDALLAQEEKPNRWAGWESHFLLGSQTYLNELEPDPGSAALFGLSVLFRSLRVRSTAEHRETGQTEGAGLLRRPRSAWR